MSELTNDEIKTRAEEYAKVWIVHTFERLLADLAESNDVPCAFEVAFIDGYMTGYTHAVKDSTGRKG